MKIRVEPSTLIVGGLPLLSFGDLVFEPGQVYCIRGRSGTGKTTFLRALRGSNSVSLTDGFVRYDFGVEDGNAPMLSKPELGVHISVLQQSSPLWPHMSALTNAWIPWASQHGVREMFRHRKEAIARASEQLRSLGLDSSVWDRKPFSLSGGERQRVALAAILVFDTPCIMLDEPTSSLDRASINLVTNALMKEADRGKLIIVTSHDVDFLENESWHHLAIDDQSKDPPRFCLHEVE
jgi:ABC-type polar amino acid transport system ATPase subunit